jgi:hypothetical protein
MVVSFFYDGGESLRSPFLVVRWVAAVRIVSASLLVTHITPVASTIAEIRLF